MVDTIVLESAELTAFTDKLATLDEGTFLAIMRQVAMRVAVKGEQLAGGYPEASGKPLEIFYTRIGKSGVTYKSKFMSMRQQGYVFWALSHGMMNIPYKRKGILGGSLTSDVIQTGDSTDIFIGSNLEYAPWVIGPVGEQSHYHEGTWTPLDELLSDGEDELLQVAEDGLGDAVSAFIG